jgi:hypothetical protein
MNEAQAVDFKVPPTIDRLLDRLATMYGSLVAFMERRAGYDNEDIPVLIFKVAEDFALVQLLGVLFGSKCQKEVEQVLSAYKDLLEGTADCVFTESYSQDEVKHLQDLLFRLKVATYMLVVACAGLPAILPAPPEPNADTQHI